MTDAVATNVGPSATSANPAPVAVSAPVLTLEQRLDLAAQQAGQIAQIISPTIGEAISAGAQFEPIFSSFIRMVVGLFKHHASQPVAPAPTV